LTVTYGIDPNRMRIIGYGSSRPLPRLPGESDRAYGYRLPRVEVTLAAENL
jgi:outer membrane protein OmpA-like peptidoglycan-associated protein